ncbi:phosphoribosylformylglycinamidine cyclo-ligase [Persicimonas caeni]|uniref:Phosphoribosylformylglycinamidine cyclo-ligase n=1 Tax=Persicimonas caeni TaxID=2292766 RepID=A0A4Y6Q3D5_PERCE|nr:phosphoribosylformylglycinamidine cyclo-ligase [Persicimonas caeni]QDG54515.1 phosphoribosylformylglycinamidine cyclo-ligase [Persicimonas caeni]QED35736.1 phosphoribosylformylglycinamidine cyclo-ligase [Persicimonas caeni]
MSDSSDKPSSYKDAGVNLEAAEETVSRLGAVVEQTRIPGVLSGIGGFGGLFGLREAGVVGDEGADPVLVSGTDGVGTKLKLAFQLDRHDTIGIDCVAMCVNDVITTGARPLFFLDYFATGKLRPDQAEDVVRGVAEGCKQSGCALIGGETAEMPGFYDEGEYDIAGFCVGAVERGAMITPEQVEDGDTIIGIASSGVHSNGFSLVRKIVSDNELDLNAVYEELASERTLGEVLLEPTRIYAGFVRDLLDAHDVHGLVHITGGGFYENLPRALPEGLGATIDASSWENPAIFDFLKKHGSVATDEMYRVFNMGIGLAVIVDDADGIIEAANECGFEAWEIGSVNAGEGIDLNL